MTSKQHIYIGGRKSKLAVTQSETIKQQILDHFPDFVCSILAFSTLGDRYQNKALYSFGGKSLWTKELEALLYGPVGDYPQIDLIVHALKDVPTNLPEEFELACITEREDPRDAVLFAKDSPYKCLADLPEGAVVGTSSVRRSAQIIKNYPHLNFEVVRGNLITRISKLDQVDSQYDCIILAAAGLRRIGLDHRINQYLDSKDMYYAVGQGALGIEIRKGDQNIINILSKIEHLPTTYSCIAERSLMRYLEGGCSVPLGVESHFNEQTNDLSLKAIIVSPDGKTWVEAESVQNIGQKADCVTLGKRVGDLLIEKGGKEILNAIDYDRINQPPVNLSELSSMKSSVASTPSPSTPIPSVSGH